MTVRSAVGLAPWTTAALAGVLFLVLLGPIGGVFAVGWGLALMAARAVARGPRVQRLAVDAALAFVAILGGYLGGWYLLPAIGLFALADAAGIEVPVLPSRARDVGPIAAAGAFLAGLAAVTSLLAGPSYASRTSSVDPGGAVAEGPTIARTFLEVNGPRGAAVLALVAILAAAVLVAALVHRAGRPGIGRPLLAFGALGISGLALLAAPTIGLLLVPAALLALLALAAMIGGAPAAGQGRVGPN